MTIKFTALVALALSAFGCGVGKDSPSSSSPDPSADLTKQENNGECYEATKGPDEPLVITSDPGDLIQPTITSPAPPPAAVGDNEKKPADILTPCAK